MVIVFFCAVSDLRFGKIPNALIAAGLLCASLGSVMLPLTSGQGWMLIVQNVLLTLSGTMLPVLMAWFLFRFRMIGAGDIKLLSMAGAFLGPCRAFRCVILSFLAGGVISAWLMFRRKNMFRRFSFLFCYLKECAQEGKMLPYLERTGPDGKFCFAVPVLAGVFLSMRASPHLLSGTAGTPLAFLTIGGQFID